VSEDILNEELEQDILDVLADQGENDEDTGNEDYAASGELPDDPEQLKTLLLQEREIKSKRNKTLKKRDDAIHRMQSELDAQNTKIEQLLSNSQDTQNSAKQQEYQETLKGWKDSVAENPEQAIDFMAAQNNDLRNTIAELMANMQSGFQEQIAELKGDMNPDKIKYREKIAKVRQIPGYENATDDEAIRFLKATERIPKQPRGSVGGQRAKTQASAEGDLDALKAQYREMMG
jgi:hypothetical protein